MLAQMIVNVRIVALLHYERFAMVRTTSWKKCKWKSALQKKIYLA